MTDLDRRTVLAGAGAMAATLAMPAIVRAQAAPTELAISMSSNAMPFGGLRIAQQMGLFEKHGFKARLIVSESGNAATTALISRSVQFAGSGPSQALTARARRQELVIVANLYRGLSGSLVLSKAAIDKTGVKPDAPVAQRIKALDGMTVASPSATSAYTGPIKNAAEQQGVKVRLVYMAQPAMPAAIETGAIQGMIAAVPFSTVPVIKGTGLLWISGPKAEFPAEFMPTSSACLQTTEAYAKANPDVVKRLQDMVLELAKVIQEHPAEAKAALGRAYPDFDPATLDQAFATDSANWAKPIFTVADMEQERKILEETESVPGVKELDLKQLLRMPA